MLWGGGLLANSSIPSASAEDNIESSNTLGTIDPSKYTVSISSSGSISPIKLKLETVPYTNVVRAGIDKVTTTISPTTSSANCRLLLSTDSTSNSLTNTTTNNNSNNEEDIPSNATIPATTGTITSPTALTNNSWGFALDNDTTKNPGLVPNGFDTDYHTANFPAVDKDSKWAAVPTKGNEVMIQTIPMNQPTTDTNIYYAISAMDTLAEGTYNGSIVYTAIYEATDIPTGELTLTPTSGTAGDEITLNSAIVPTMEDIGALDIKLVDPATSTEYPCENITTTKTSQGNLQAKCNIPTLPSYKEYTVTATYSKTGETYTSTQTFGYGNRYNVYYNTNGGSNVPATQSALDGDDHTFTLTDLNSSQIPTRSGYTFGGWTTVPTNQAGAYSPGSELYLKKESPEATLYAIWVPNSEMRFGSLTGSNAKMQNMTSTICSNVSQGTTGRLQDTRDYKIYSVSKLADGQCWMSQNLSLELSTDKILTNQDTDLTSVASWTPERNTIPANNLNNTTWQDDAYHPYSYNPGDDYFVTSGTQADDFETNSGDYHYTAGNYYNWSVAVAANNTSSYSAGSDAPNSICPKGWRLTTSSGSAYGGGEVNQMLYAQGVVIGTTVVMSYTGNGFTLMRSTPLWLVRSGYVGGSRTIF